jgi:cbb3-type cytochrome oxidase maturation protein
MDEATIALTVMSVLIMLVFLGFLIWGMKSGQFRNTEEAKYQIFRRPGTTGDDGSTKGHDKSVKKEAKRDAT